MRKKLLLIDTFNFLHRAFHALPPTLTDREGNPTNAIYGTTSMFITVFDNLKPDYAVAALDSIKPTFRVEDFTGYKAHRKPMDDALASQIDKMFAIIDAFGVKKITVDGYEADDIIGTMAERFAEDDLEVIIASNDRDLWQLINDNVIVMTPSTKGQNEWIGKKEAEARMGIKVEQITDYKGLKGDASDNIPGVYGVGDKTAKKLIEEFGSVEGIYRNLGKVAPDSLRTKLEENYEQALMSKKLATIITDVPFTVALDECKYTEFNKGQVKDELAKYNFKSLIRRLGFEDYGKGSSKSQEIDKNQTALF